MKKLLTFCLISLGSFLYAQLDTKHYLQPLLFSYYNSNTVTEEFIYLSTPSTTDITVKVTYADEVSIPRLSVHDINADNTYTVTNGIITFKTSTPIRVQLIDNNDEPLTPGTSAITRPTTTAGTIINANVAGLIFESNANFFVNYRARSTAQAGSVLTKGNAALGRQFFWGGTPIQYTTTIPEVGNMLSIMATEDNTTFTISNIKSGTEFINGSNSTPIQSTTITRTLQKGQSFILFARVKTSLRSSQDDGWLGAKILSNKDIAVTVGGLMQLGDAASGTSTDNRDIGVDQLVPVNQLGNEHIVMQGNGGSSEKVIVIATENNTSVTINNNTSPSYNIANEGGYIIIPGNQFVDKNMFIKTNKAVYVFHKIFGSSGLNTNSFMFIPPLSCFGQKEVNMIPDAKYIGTTSYANTELAILSAGGLIPTVTLNGSIIVNPISTIPANGTAVPGNSNWRTFRYNIGGAPAGKHIRITSTGTIQAELIGADGAAGFGGYFSGFGTKPTLFIQVINSPTDRPCTGDTGNSNLDLSTASGLGTYQWYKNGEPITGATNHNYSIPAIDDDPSEYSVVVTAPGGCLIFSNVVKSYACPCYKPGTLGTPEPTKFGISTKQIPTTDNWPTSINNGFLALESTNKGMVITRVSEPETTIENPIDGMIVFDTNDSCIKLYSNNQWKCINQTCN